MRNSLVFISMLALGFSAVANADVTVQKKTSMSGLMGMGVEGQDIQYIKGDKCYHETTSKFTSGIMKTMTGGKGGGQQQIIRIDKQLVWNLAPERNSYTEMNFDVLRQSIQQASSMYSGSDEQPGSQGDYTWTISVKPPAKTETINGFNCKHVIGAATGINKKDPADTTVITMQYWLGKNIVGQQELQAFGENYAKALNVDELEMQQGMQAMFKNFRDEFTRLADEFKKLGGYPIKTAISIKSSAVKSGHSEVSSGAGDHQQSISDLMGKLGSKAAGKDEKKENQENPHETFSMTSEIINISTGAIDDSKFEVPARFQKQEIK